MRLSRKWARILRVLYVLCAVMASLYLLTSGWLKAVLWVVTVVMLITVSLLWSDHLRCRYCDKRVRENVLFSRRKRMYCCFCGKPLVYDDEPEDPA